MRAMYSLVADMILVVHFGFIAFIIGGQVGVIVGYFRNWRWIRNLTFRLCHILAIAIVAALAWGNRLCPLTVWERALRDAGGDQSYPGSFVGYWIGRFVYYDAPQWVFTIAYSFFGVLVLFTWIGIRPEKDMTRRATGNED